MNLLFHNLFMAINIIGICIDKRAIPVPISLPPFFDFAYYITMI